MPWYVLYTKPQNERKIAARLKNIGIEAYCPLRTEIRQWSDRKKKMKVPLLPSMLLVNVQENARNMVYQVPGVQRYMFWLGKPAMVSQKEVDALQEMETQKNNDKLKVETLKPGAKLDLTKMGFHAQEGTVKYVSGNQCWVVLEGLGYVIKIEI